ncbi:hypothetical protein PROFUN_07694 [Planoprotostelium fungivorum]|uniref:U-box domain-containing protein n=1 Tax=Planoprotostelium fungivorum TaxID=1890364 RepID=A0A2P6MM70_9EUKA|nr:hypothetical protein PROFUN_07694 [Planoprotostelium fungivorum]
MTNHSVSPYVRARLTRATRQRKMHESQRDRCKISLSIMLQELENLNEDIRYHENKLDETDEEIENLTVQLQRAIASRPVICDLMREALLKVDDVKDKISDAERILRSYEDRIREGRSKEIQLRQEQRQWLSGTAESVVQTFREGLSACVNAINGLNLACPSPPVPPHVLLQKRNFIDTVEDDLLCPISGEIMDDPVLTIDGHTYDRKSIEMWFSQGHRTSPITNVRLSDLQLTPNHKVKSMIDTLRTARRAD